MLGVLLHFDKVNKSWKFEVQLHFDKVNKSWKSGE